MRWETTRQFDRVRTSDERHSVVDHDAIVNNCTLLLAAPREGLSPEVWREYQMLLGQALTCCLKNDYVNGAAILEGGRQFMRARSEERSRFWYLSASGVSTLPPLVLGLLLWAGRDFVERVLGSDFLWLAMAATLGSVGALLSVILRSGKLNFDSFAAKRLHYLEAGSRIVAGAISGMLVAFAVKYRIVLGGLTADPGMMNGIMMLGALVGGSGERLASSIISTFEGAKVDIAERPVSAR
ncbi:MAG TPA: hypothetical protein VGB91_15500 [Rhizomicrobium sp.]